MNAGEYGEIGEMSLNDGFDDFQKEATPRIRGSGRKSLDRKKAESRLELRKKRALGAFALESVDSSTTATESSSSSDANQTDCLSPPAAPVDSSPIAPLPGDVDNLNPPLSPQPRVGRQGRPQRRGSTGMYAEWLEKRNSGAPPRKNLSANNSTSSGGSLSPGALNRVRGLTASSHGRRGMMRRGSNRCLMGRSPHRTRSARNLMNSNPSPELDANGKPVLKSILRKGRFSKRATPKVPKRNLSRNGSGRSFRGSLHRPFPRVTFCFADEGSVCDTFASEDSLQLGDFTEWGDDDCLLDGSGNEMAGFHESFHSGGSFGNSVPFIDSFGMEEEDDDLPVFGRGRRGFQNFDFNNDSDDEEAEAEESYFAYEDMEEEIKNISQHSECQISDNSLSSLQSDSEPEASTSIFSRLKAVDELGGASTGSQTLDLSCLEEELQKPSPPNDSGKDDSVASETSSESPTGVTEFRKVVNDEQKEKESLLEDEEYVMPLKI